MNISRFRIWVCLLMILSVLGFEPELALTARAQVALGVTDLPLYWSDEFNGSGSVNSSDWICDTGTGYPGGPGQWGTNEIESYTCNVNNVFQSGGNLNLRALHAGTAPLSNWTSGRIETQRSDFQPSSNGIMAVEARIKLPAVNNSDGLGYWPAFWMLGAPYRGNYWNWPSVGEIDIMENVNGRNKAWWVFHCGTAPGGPCKEYTGLGGTKEGLIPALQDDFHIFRVELDRSKSPQEVRWYIDGEQMCWLDNAAQRCAVTSDQFDATTWNNATNHGFFILLNLAIGGDFPNSDAGGITPTSLTKSGGTMLVDYVRVFKGPVSSTGPRTILYSIGSQDGWILESTETSETGGSMDPTSTVLTMGDNASDRQYRTMLSFDTSSLPDTAVITKSVLSLRVNEILGSGNPIKTFNYFTADVMNGSFGGSPTLTLGDFSNTPTMTVGPLGVLNRGGWYHVDLKTGKAAVSTTDLTQIRLRFTLDDNDNGIENIVKIYSGNSAINPQLSLWYYVP